MTLIVNMLGGPGSGKSTTALGVAFTCKKLSMNIELVTEAAKDYTWEERWGILACQPAVFGEQLLRLERLIGKVDIVITDSPILLSAAYNARYGGDFTRSVINIFQSHKNLNLFMKRTKSYVQHGRTQTLQEAVELDNKVRQILDAYSIVYTEIGGDADEKVNSSISQIFGRLGVDISGV